MRTIDTQPTLQGYGFTLLKTPDKKLPDSNEKPSFSPEEYSGALALDEGVNVFSVMKCNPFEKDKPRENGPTPTKSMQGISKVNQSTQTEMVGFFPKEQSSLQGSLQVSRRRKTM